MPKLLRLIFAVAALAALAALAAGAPLLAQQAAKAAKTFGAKVGGKVSPAGAEIHVDLPEDLHRRNTSSRGQGCCVFTSLHMASLWQNIPQLHEFPKWLQAKGLPGGGYPGNVTDRIAAICKERGMAQPAYFHVTNGDLEILKAACKSGRMPAVTYYTSPTGRYGGGRISHMVSLVHADDAFFCVLDNNYIGVKQYEWMTPQEFARTHGGKSGWSVILLDPGPPPVPRN